MGKTCKVGNKKTTLVPQRGRVKSFLIGNEMTLAMPVIDVEASGLDEESYPIEVGFVLDCGSSFNFLIKPLRKWKHWDNTAQGIHGISQAKLHTDGQKPIDVARKLNEILGGTTIYCDAVYYDTFWIDKLFTDVKLKRKFVIKDIQSCFANKNQLTHYHKIKNDLFEKGGVRHRADVDAGVLYEAFRLSYILKDSVPVFSNGNRVLIKHQPDLGEAKVVDSCVPTDAIRIDGDPVRFYVEIKLDRGGKVLRYHESSLEKLV